jgi:prepilin-type processing-associated H-X9-DG protein/prepilin-type N-terminal cleavage/methylation domain-containing protein
MKSRGLALIELLVVIAIIALLMALSVSVLRAAREQVKSTICQTHQRQLLLNISMYEMAWGTLPRGFALATSGPPAGGYAGDVALDGVGWWWFNSLGIRTPDPLSRKSTILDCPSRVLADFSLRSNCLYGNYGLNWSLCKGSVPGAQFREFKGSPLATSRLLKASRTLLIADSGYAVIGWHHVTANPPFPLADRSGFELSYMPGLGINQGRMLLSGQRQDAEEGRHPNKTVNIGLADGHVERQACEALLVTKTDETYGNLSPLWKPLCP